MRAHAVPATPGDDRFRRPRPGRRPRGGVGPRHTGARVERIRRRRRVAAMVRRPEDRPLHDTPAVGCRDEALCRGAGLQGRRNAFRVDSGNFPLLAALVEVITLEPEGAATRVVYRQAFEFPWWLGPIAGL